MRSAIERQTAKKNWETYLAGVTLFGESRRIVERLVEELERCHQELNELDKTVPLAGSWQYDGFMEPPSSEPAS